MVEGDLGRTEWYTGLVGKPYNGDIAAEAAGWDVPYVVIGYRYGRTGPEVRYM